MCPWVTSHARTQHVRISVAFFAPRYVIKSTFSSWFCSMHDLRLFVWSHVTYRTVLCTTLSRRDSTFSFSVSQELASSRHENLVSLLDCKVRAMQWGEYVFPLPSWFMWLTETCSSGPGLTVKFQAVDLFVRGLNIQYGTGRLGRFTGLRFIDRFWWPPDWLSIFVVSFEPSDRPVLLTNYSPLCALWIRKIKISKFLTFYIFKIAEIISKINEGSFSLAKKRSVFGSVRR